MVGKVQALARCRGRCGNIAGDKRCEAVAAHDRRGADHLVAEILLQLPKQASSEVWLLFEVREVELPLVMEKDSACWRGDGGNP